jgi:hypothetical protein
LPFGLFTLFVDEQLSSVLESDTQTLGMGFLGEPANTGQLELRETSDERDLAYRR